MTKAGDWNVVYKITGHELYQRSNKIYKNVYVNITIIGILEVFDEHGEELSFYASGEWFKVHRVED